MSDCRGAPRSGDRHANVTGFADKMRVRWRAWAEANDMSACRAAPRSGDVSRGFATHASRRRAPSCLRGQGRHANGAGFADGKQLHRCALVEAKT